MLVLCLMLLVTYHALNYAGIIGLGLAPLYPGHWHTACLTINRELTLVLYAI